MTNTYKVVVTFRGGRAFTTNVLLPCIGLPVEFEINLAEKIGIKRIYKEHLIQKDQEPEEVETFYISDSPR